MDDRTDYRTELLTRAARVMSAATDLFRGDVDDDAELVEAVTALVELTGVQLAAGASINLRGA